jgi:hypothetical protein
MILSASTTALLQHIIAKLHDAFAVKDMGPLRHFLGINVRRTAAGFFLSQSTYADELLERAGMANCKPVATPADTKSKASIVDGKLHSLPEHYRRVAVLDDHASGHRLCRATGLPPHAGTAGCSPDDAETHSSLRQGHDEARHPATICSYADDHYLFGR